MSAFRDGEFYVGSSVDEIYSLKELSIDIDDLNSNYNTGPNT